MRQLTAAQYVTLSLSFKRRSLHLLAGERITGLPTILRLPSTAIHCILLAFARLDLTTPKMTNSHRFLAAGKQILFSFLSHHFSLGFSCLFNARYLLRQTFLHLRLNGVAYVMLEITICSSVCSICIIYIYKIHEYFAYAIISTYC